MGNPRDRANHRLRLKSVGLRHTLPREHILNYLDRKNTHPTPEELYLGLKRKGHHIGLSTVYLNLQVLREAALIWEFKDPKGNTRFDGFNEKHHHLFCLQCGAVEDIAQQELTQLETEPSRKAIEAKNGWYVAEARLELRGVCPNCQ